jgi:hypothetical protein
MDIEKFNRIASKSRKLGLIKECFYHDKSFCKGDIKQAHSIQCNGRISILESEVNKNQSVYSFDQFKSDEKNVISELVAIGKKKASTFLVFVTITILQFFHLLKILKLT